MTDRFTRRIYLVLAEGRDLSAVDEGHLAACSACQAAAARAREFDRVLQRELAGLRAPMPADPFDVTETPRRSRALLQGLATGLVVLVAGLASVGVLTGLEPDPSSEPSAVPTASESSAGPSPSPTPQPTPSPSASPEPSAEAAVQAGDYAVGSADELVLYDRPDGTPFDQARPGLELHVIGVEDGWVEVQAPQLSSIGYVFGWVQASAIEPFVPSLCLEAEPGTYLWFGSASHPMRDLECYGDGPLVARGYAIEQSGDDVSPYTGEPGWLVGPSSLVLSSAIGPAVTGFSVSLHLPPELEGTIPTSDREGHEGTLLSVTGHFDDPRASGCSLVPVAEGHPPVEPRNAELWCRQRFVVDAVEIVEPEG